MLHIYTITINYQKVKKILFKTVSKTKQNKTMLGINLTKEVKNLYSGNYKALIKTEDDLKK